MAVKAPVLNLKLADSVAPKPALFTAERLPVCAWSAASPAPSWLCLNQSALNSASWSASNQGVQNRTKWLRCFQNCTPYCDTYVLKKCALREQIRVHSNLWVPSTKLGGWGYGGGQVFWKSQALPLCLGHFSTKLWPCGAPSAYWVLH